MEHNHDQLQRPSWRLLLGNIRENMNNDLENTILRITQKSG